MIKKLNTGNIAKIAFLILSIIFAVPSIIYIIQNGNILDFASNYKFLMTDQISRKCQTIIFLVILTLMCISYFEIIKKQNQIFKNIKHILIFVAIITIAFAIILPFTSSDVFYYIGVGWLDSNYHQNPYYTSMNEYMEKSKQAAQDQILIKGADYWGAQTVVYGPLWQLMCRIFTSFSFGSVGIALIIFKMASVGVHLFNTYLIHKTTGKNVFAIIYGLNPFVLFETIANVHNDLYLALFILLGMYFLIKKKNILITVIMLALGACIKYVTILLVPFVLIYYFRKEQKLSTRFVKCIKYGLIFILCIAICYLIYIRDFNVLKGIADQQGKYTKSIQTVLVLNKVENIEYLQKILMAGFLAICVMFGINEITKKHITLHSVMKKYNYLLYIFIPIIITNFQPWYLMWLIPTMFWQNGTTLKHIIAIPIFSQFANYIFMKGGEHYEFSKQYVLVMAIGIIAILIATKKEDFKLGKISINRWK